MERISRNMNDLNKFRLYDLSEVAKILGVTHRTVWNYVKSGKIPAKMVGGKWKINELNLTAYINGTDNQTNDCK